MAVQHAIIKKSSDVTTQAVVSQQDLSVIEVMTVKTGLMNKTAVSDVSVYVLIILIP